MKFGDPKHVRREIMTILYESYLADPMQMLSPTDIIDYGTVARRDLLANVYYLHERNLIEMMVGYNPPMFAATRISPQGMDLYEDDDAFNKMFPLGPRKRSETLDDVIPLMLKLVQEAEQADLRGARRDWLLADINGLRDSLRRPEDAWDAKNILTRLQWLDGFFMHEENAPLPSLEELKTLLYEKFL